MNLTLVAFYGFKPEPLRRLVDLLQSALSSELGPAFFPYAMEKVHAPLIGLEGWRSGVETFNANAAQTAGQTSALDLHGLFQFMLEMPAFRIQIGGSNPDGIYPFTSRGLHPYLRSFSIRDSLAVMMGWPAAGASYPIMQTLQCPSQVSSEGR
jgi:hypothetical protein